MTTELKECAVCSAVGAHNLHEDFKAGKLRENNRLR